MNRDALARASIALADMLATLRGPGGCPWDAQQTDRTIKMYLLEESYEVLDALEGGNPEEVCGELGDLLFQILFLARLAEERREFDMVDVIRGISQKMHNRHPHVFGTLKVGSVEEVADNWAEIKKKENKGTQTPYSRLQSIPAALPALLHAHRLSERASRDGWQGPGEQDLLDGLEGRIGDIRRGVAANDEDRLGEQIGNLLFDIVQIARDRGLNAENLLREKNREYIRRFKERDGG